MRLEVRLFAVCRDKAGTDRLPIDLEGDSVSVEELQAALVGVCPVLAPLMPVVRVAINEAFAAPGQQITAADEVALIPPVSGGSGRGPFSVREAPITVAEVEQAVAGPSAGAIVSFTGTVRDRTGPHDVEALEYEAYVSMAERYLDKIGAEIEAQWAGARVAILHRTGRLGVGEPSVVIAVAHPHRAEAFDGCRYAIEQLKKDVPIWKKEVRTDGSVWVGVGS